ncbi:cysteine hydrolase family protein [Roseiconus lacunae]|uniref:Isochorismatase family cysteine hydrolase n=1 Tax=Roseiconus lacunae TaxID=2605694 RepID=A0ABT7PPP9_9BACT|nr:isochorismatase family cysteine hydrolase [Roseiconus lacunae]MCD0462992.1 cysteine hydrolase [Roseiconus lacunae]MDM4018478.1 isochorismatase family cysteine hydrolase [Roseiconus lacunae]WRQ49101.1 isochorismatase family cysteine hydrolase [Stieleria sp. HD01]
MNSGQSKPGHLDPLKDVYHEAFVENPAQEAFLKKGTVALLCIDLQYLDAARGHGVFRDATQHGVSPEAQEYYFNRLETMVLPGVRRMQDAFRKHQLEVIHTRIQSLTRDGRDRSKGHRRLGLLAPPGSRDADFIESVGPVEEQDEIVINKTASGVFSSTNLHYVLKNLGIEALYVVGVYTNECVETTVRDACDLGYLVTVVEDCCATVTRELHNASLATLRDRYARIVQLDEALENLSEYHEVNA